MRKSTMVAIAGIVTVAILLSVLLFCFKDEIWNFDVSTAPTSGMDFSFDESDIAASHDESTVISVIQGEPLSQAPSEDSKAEGSSSEDGTSEDPAPSLDGNSSLQAPSEQTPSEQGSQSPSSAASESSATQGSAAETSEPVQSGDIYITVAGTHIIEGAFTDRMIIVEVAKTEKVKLVLKNAVINNTKGPAIIVKSADKVTITAFEGTKNHISDGADYTLTVGTANADAAIFSLEDLTVNGTGSLTVNGNNRHGIVSKDRVVISQCTLNVVAKGTAVNGKDYVKIKDGALTLTGGDDGISSDNAQDATKGYIYIEGGTINITAAHDGIQAQTVLKSDAASITVVSGGGGNVPLGTRTDDSYKGLKALSDILIAGGSYNISSRDDCIHSNGTISITGGTMRLSSGNDAFHANNDFSVEGGDINVTNCFEGIDASRVVIVGGTIGINASDDGIMAVSIFDMSGGTLYIDADGDGIDSNGNLQMRGGVLVISGPTSNLDGALDCAGSSVINGGVVVALGSSPMAQGFASSPSQGTAFCKFNTQPAGTLLTLRDTDGNAIVAFAPQKAYSSAVISAPSIKKGSTYTLYAGGTADGLDGFGFAQNTACGEGSLLLTVNMKSTLFQGGSTAN